MKLSKILDKEKYKKLKDSLGCENDLAVPSIEKIVVNAGLNDKGLDEKKLIELRQQIANITGQLPIIRRAKNTISAFDVREGQPVGLQVTLRKKKMVDFLNKIVKIILPSIKGFKGIPQKSVTNQGNLTIGLDKDVTFPEIDYDEVNTTTGMGVTFVTGAESSSEAKKIFESLGIVFESEEARRMRLEAERKRKEEKKQIAQKRKAYKEMAREKAKEEEGEMPEEEEEEV